MVREYAFHTTFIENSMVINDGQPVYCVDCAMHILNSHIVISSEPKLTPNMLKNAVLVINITERSKRVDYEMVQKYAKAVSDTKIIMKDIEVL